MSSLFVVTLVATCKNADVDFDAVVGQPARFSIRSGPYERSWSGLCNRLQQIGIEEGGASTYHVNLVPMLWLATQRRNHRIFQQITEPDIVLKLLGEWYINPDVRLTSAYKKRSSAPIERAEPQSRGESTRMRITPGSLSTTAPPTSSTKPRSLTAAIFGERVASKLS